jgi:hypothetical protein
LFALLGLAAAVPASAQTIVWEHKAKGQLIASCDGNSYYAPNNNKWNQAQVIGDAPASCGGAPGFEWEPSNWTTPTYPNSPTASVKIDSAPPVELDVAVDVGALQVASGNELTLLTGSVLQVHNSIANDGLIRLDDLSGGDTILRIGGNVSLTGSGQILLDSDDDNVIDSADPSYVLTIGADQTVLADSDTLINQSFIVTSFLNNGTITVDGGWLQIKDHPKTNANLMRAVNGGTLRLLNTTVTNTAGTITAETGSVVSLGGATIVGGTLNGSGTIELETSDAVFDGTASPVTLGGTANLGSDDALTIKGTVTNDGTLVLNDVGGSVAELKIDGAANLGGAGQVVFQSDDDNWITSETPTDVLTIGPDQELITSEFTIAGDSATRITAAFANNGTITADQGGLQIDTNPKTNNSLIHAVNGGLIRFANVTVVNDEGGADPAIGTITAEAGSTVRLAAATIVGGTLNGAGSFTLEGRASVFHGSAIPPTFAGTLTVNGANTLTLRGTVHNQGAIHLDDHGWAAVLKIDGDVTLDGSGQVRFESNDDNVIESTDPADTLTVGADQTLVTAASTLAGQSFVYAAMVNQGVVEARVGGLTLSTNPKTNNGIFRAADGGTLQILAPDTVLTNYDGATHTLTGGRWEVLANGTDTTMAFEGGPAIERIGPGAAVVLSGAMSKFPGTEALVTLDGTLSLRNKRIFATNGNLDVNGHLEFGLTDGTADGWDATMLHVVNIDLTGAVIDVVDLGLKPGTYHIIQYDGTRTGTPVLGTVPSGYAFTLDTGTAGRVDLLVDTAPEPPTGRITSSGILNSTTGEAFEYHITADNNPTAFTATGLPAGLSLDPATGIISGTPSASGLFTVTVTAVGPQSTIQQKLTLVAHAPETTVFSNTNIGGVSSGPSNPTTFTLAESTRITYVMDYHYFNHGTPPGTIALRHSDGTTYGPWQAEGGVGQGGVQNAYWEVWPMVVLKPGTYTIVDSDPSTWSHNSGSGNQGMSVVKGEAAPATDAEIRDLWMANHGLEGADATPEADPDDDSIPNWIEIAVGSDPTRRDAVALPQLATTSTAGGAPSVSFTVCAGGTGVPGGTLVVNGARIVVKVASDMADWEASTELLDLANAERQELGDGRETLTLPLKPGMLPQGSWFIRAELTQVAEP